MRGGEVAAWGSRRRARRSSGERKKKKGETWGEEKEEKGKMREMEETEEGMRRGRKGVYIEGGDEGGVWEGRLGCSFTLRERRKA